MIRKQDHFDEVQAIVEQKELTPEQAQIREINTGFYAFLRESLYAHIDRLEAKNAQGEFYLTDMAGILNAAGEQVAAVEAQDPDEVLGANTIRGNDGPRQQIKASECASPHGKWGDNFPPRNDRDRLLMSLSAPTL